MSRQAIERAVEALEQIAKRPDGKPPYSISTELRNSAREAVAMLRKELDQPDRRAANPVLTEEEIKLVAEHRVAAIRSWDAPGFEACVWGAADELRKAMLAAFRDTDEGRDNLTKEK